LLSYDDEEYWTMRDFDPLESGSRTGESLSDLTPDRHDDTVPSGPAVLVDALPANARIIITTRNSRYRFVVIEGSNRRVQMTGGRLFPDATEMVLEGAVTTGGAIKPGWITVGLPVALSIGLRRITTSCVESVAFERVPSEMSVA
jgi:hypothetical protein